MSELPRLAAGGAAVALSLGLVASPAFATDPSNTDSGSASGTQAATVTVTAPKTDAAPAASQPGSLAHTGASTVLGVLAIGLVTAGIVMRAASRGI